MKGISIVVVLTLFGAFVISLFRVSNGRLPSPIEVVERLASRPDVADRFTGEGGPFEAQMLLFTAILLGPAVLVLGAIAVAAALALLHVVGDALHLPDGFAKLLAAVVVAGVAYAKVDLWLAPSLQIIALLARAYIVAWT